MYGKFTSRSLIVWALLAGMTAAWGELALAQGRAPVARQPVAFTRVSGKPNASVEQQQQPAPIERRPPPAAAAQPGGAGAPHLAGPSPVRGSVPKGEHLAEWMDQHSNLTLEQQQAALDREPGFRELPAATQERMRERLSQLNAMTPLQRQRLLAHNEAMERLNPEQRTQVRGAMQMLGALPLDQRKQVARSFRQIRELPPNQRMRAMMSPQYSWLNETQRTTLTRLIQVEPMLPPQ